MGHFFPNGPYVPVPEAVVLKKVTVHGFARDSTVATREVGAWTVRRDVRGEAISRESARCYEVSGNNKGAGRP